MDHIPTPKIDRNPAVEAAARMRDVTDRAKAVHPVAQGADILQSPRSGLGDLALRDIL